MKADRIAALGLLFLLSVCSTAWAGAPSVLVAQPGNGEKNVATDIGRITIFFSRPMDTRSWSLLKAPGCKYPPLILQGSPWQSGQKMVLTVDKLAPGTRYGFQLNDGNSQGFRAADDSSPLPPTRIVFTTGGNASPTTAAPGAAQAGGAPPGGGSTAPKQLSEEEQLGLQVTGSVLAIMFHELGHCFIEIYQLPFTGREEDAVDEFSTLLLLEAGKEGVAHVPDLIGGIADFFFLLNKYAQKTPFWDEHTGQLVRFGNVLCYLYGSDPQRFQALVEKLKMPPKRQYICRKDFSRKVKVWEGMLKQHTRAAGATGPGKVRVVHEDVKSEWAEQFQKIFKNGRFFEELADGINQEFALPYDITFRIVEGNGPTAHWDPDKREIVFGYSMIKLYLELLDRNNRDTGQAGGGRAGGQGSAKRRVGPLDPRLFGTWMGQAQQGYVTFVLKTQLGQDGRYYSQAAMVQNNKIFAQEEESGLYEAQGGRVTFKVIKSSEANNKGRSVTFSYQVQGRTMVLNGVPAIAGQPLYLQRVQ